MGARPAADGRASCSHGAHPVRVARRHGVGKRRRSACTGRAGRALRRFGAAVPADGSHLEPGPGGCRPSVQGSRASAPPWPGTSRRPATTTANATGCAHRTSTETASPTGRGCRQAARWRRPAFGAEPDTAAWANACMLNPSRLDPKQRREPAVRAAAGRLADHAERGLARMAELAREPLPGQLQGASRPTMTVTAVGTRQGWLDAWPDGVRARWSCADARAGARPAARGHRRSPPRKAPPPRPVRRTPLLSALLAYQATVARLCW